MLKAEIFQIESSIFHRTVLEGYWEFGARIGTKMKLAVSTFSSFRLFLFSKTTKLLNFWKHDKISFQNTTLTSRVWANTLDKIQDIAFWRYVYTRISKKVSTLNACAVWSRTEHFLDSPANKNNYARNEIAYARLLLDHKAEVDARDKVWCYCWWFLSASSHCLNIQIQYFYVPSASWYLCTNRPVPKSHFINRFSVGSCLSLHSSPPESNTPSVTG